MQSKEETTHSSLCFVLFFAQCFGMLPVTGITGENSSSLRFRWISKRTVYSLTFAAVAAANTFLFVSKMVREGRQEFSDWGKHVCFAIQNVNCGHSSYSFVFSGHGGHSGNIHRRSKEMATSYGEMDRS